MSIEAIRRIVFAGPAISLPCRGFRWAHVLRAALAWASLAALSIRASAYRPFDGTDASVAELGHIEFELQGFGCLQEGSAKSLVAPAAVINYGFIENWEAVLQGELESEVSPSHRESLTGNDVFLKHIVREGALQDKSGPSIATEFGLLLPNIDAGPTFVRPSWIWIISDRFPWETVHLNFTANIMSDPRQDFLRKAGPLFGDVL